MRKMDVGDIREEILEAEEVIITKTREAVGRIPEEFSRLDAYKMCSYFLICAFIGWIWETVAVWVTTGVGTDRGFLFIMRPLGHYLPFIQNMTGLASVPFIWGLPIIMVYGIGGVAVCSSFKHWDRHPLELFFVGMVSLTLLELFSSYLCDWLLHHQYWDYSSKFLNFQGRICLSSTLAWGVLCVLGVKVFSPRIDHLYLHINSRRNFKVIVLILIGYAAVCAVVKYFLDPGIIPN